MQESSTIAQGLIRIERDGVTYLGVDTGIPANSPSLRKLAGQRRQTGWIVDNGIANEWQPKGFVEHEGRVHVYGPMFEGRTFDELIHDQESDRLELLARLAATYVALRESKIAPFQFHARSLVFQENGSVLVLPPDILGAIRDHQDYAERVSRMERFSHPDRAPRDNESFVLATSAYYVVTGSFPFEGHDEEELHARVRAASPLPAHLRLVGVRTDVSEALQRELESGAEAVTADPAHWARLLRSWNEEGVVAELTTEQREAVESEARQTQERLDRGFRRRESVRRNGRTAVIVAIIAIVVGSIPATIIRSALAPRATAGLPPEQVVEVFYSSFNTLDHMTMEDAVVDDAGVDLVREVTNLFVIDRQRMSVEMESGFVDAAAWREAGMPTLSGGRTPYGVYNLQLESLSAPDGEVAYRVRYERWLPDYEQAETSGRSGIFGAVYVDLLRLRQDREDWVIYERIPESQEPIDLRALRAEAG